MHKDRNPTQPGMKSYLQAFCAFLLLVSIALIQSVEEMFNWRDLTPDELKAWYSPTDLCALESTHYKHFPQHIRSKNCSQHSGGSRRMHCGVGMGANNNPCYGPFSSARPSFKRGIDGYTDANSKPLTRVFLNTLKTNTTLVIVGDSTMRQKMQALECQLLHEDPRTITRGDMYGIVPCDTVLRVWFHTYHLS